MKKICVLWNRVQKWTLNFWKIATILRSVDNFNLTRKIVKILWLTKSVKIKRFCFRWLLTTSIWREKLWKLFSWQKAWKLDGFALDDCWQLQLQFDDKSQIYNSVLPNLSQIVLFKIFHWNGDTTYQILSQNSYFCVMLLKTWKTLYYLAELNCQITIVICVLKRKQKC